MNDKTIPHGTASGYTSHKCRCDNCKAWSKESCRRYRETHSNEIRDRRRAYYLKTRERTLERGRRHYRENREQIRERQREYYEQNRQSISESSRCYYQATRDDRRKHAREYGRAMRSHLTARSAKKNDISREKATRNGKRWTAHEDSIARDTSLTVIEAASALQRTCRSVKYRRSVLTQLQVSE